LVLPYAIAQLLGAITGAALMYAFYYPHFCKATDPSAIAAPFATSPALRNLGSNFLSEVLGTFVLILVILFFTNPGLDDAAQTPVGLGSLGALPVALLVWAIGLSLGGTTGYAINPARDLGPRLVHQLAPIKRKGNSDWAYAWVPVAGPLLGAALAAGLFLLLTA
jgi:glycerol uptake facilitator protein